MTVLVPRTASWSVSLTTPWPATYVTSLDPLPLPQLIPVERKTAPTTAWLSSKRPFAEPCCSQVLMHSGGYSADPLHIVPCISQERFMNCLCYRRIIWPMIAFNVVLETTRMFTYPLCCLLFCFSRLGHKIQGVLCDGDSNEVVASTVVNCLKINEGTMQKYSHYILSFLCVLTDTF